MARFRWCARWMGRPEASRRTSLLYQARTSAPQSSTRSRAGRICEQHVGLWLGWVSVVLVGSAVRLLELLVDGTTQHRRFDAMHVPPSRCSTPCPAPGPPWRCAPRACAGRARAARRATRRRPRTPNNTCAVFDWWMDDWIVCVGT